MKIINLHLAVGNLRMYHFYKFILYKEKEGSCKGFCIPIIDSIRKYNFRENV